MIFGAKALYTTNEILDSLLKTGDIKDTTGAVSIVKKDGRKTVASGKIYFRNELIYAVEVANREIPIGRRVESGGLVDQDDLDGIFRRVGDKTSPRIVDQLLVAQLISEKNLNNYVKEHFIDTLGEILSWDNATGEWHPNVTTADFVMPYVALDKIRAILDNRASFHRDFAIAVRSFFKEDEIRKLTFSSSVKDPSTYPAEIRAILRRADGEYSVSAIAADTGISEFAVFQSVISLWKKGLLSLQLGGISLPFTSLQEAVKPKPVETVKTEQEDSFVPLASEIDEPGTLEVDAVEEHIKDDNAVSEEFVTSTHDYEDEPEVALEDEEDIEASSDSAEDDESHESDEEFLSSNDDPTVDLDSEDPSQDDEFITYEEEDSDEVTHVEVEIEPETLPDYVEDTEPESEPEPHFSNLPLPIRTPDTDTQPEIAKTSETKKEVPLTTIPNVSEANDNITSFTLQLNELQQELSLAATKVTEAKEALEDYENALIEAEKNLEEAKRGAEIANVNYENAKDSIASSEEYYAKSVSRIEGLIQSFKFSG